MALCCFTLISCDDLATQEGSSCDDLGTYVKALDITDIELSTITQLYFQENPTYPTYNPLDLLYLTGESVAYDSLVLSLDAITEDLLAQQQQSNPFEFSLFAKAYACDFPLPTPQEKITEITITSTNAFNDDTPAGSPLTAFFDVIYAFSETDFYSRENGKIDYFSVEEYLQQSEVNASEAIQLRLNTAPDYLTNQKFFITIRLDSGEEFMLESDEVSFLAP